MNGYGSFEVGQLIKTTQIEIMFAPVRISFILALIGTASAACNPGGNFDEETGIPCGMCGDLISVAAFDNFNPSLS